MEAKTIPVMSKALKTLFLWNSLFPFFKSILPHTIAATGKPIPIIPEILKPIIRFKFSPNGKVETHPIILLKVKMPSDNNPVINDVTGRL